MRIPMALRRVKPGAAHLAVPCHDPEWVISHMPVSLPRMRTWLRAVHDAHRGAGPGFAEWTARHASQIPCGSENELLSFLYDTADWVRASHGNDGHQFVVRPFKPTMSVKTVTKLSAEWHEAVASNLTGPQHTFPEPWFPAATINGVEIIPIDNSADLYREGAFMHHCIGTYSEEVRVGRYYVYSIRRNGERVATAGLVLQGARAVLHQLRGPCNGPAPKQITTTVKRWLRAQAPIREQWPSREAASRAAGVQDSADDSDRWMQTIEEEEAKRLAWGDLENDWHHQHGKRCPSWQCAGCDAPIGGSQALNLPDGNRVHLEPIDCLIRFGKRWRGAAREALVASGLEPPGPGGDQL
jgi:hypothetical protein